MRVGDACRYEGQSRSRRESGDDAHLYLDLRVDAEDEELWWVQAEVPHVDPLFTLEFDSLVVNWPESHIGFQTPGHTVEGQISTKMVAGPIIKSLDLAHLANHPGILSDFQPILKLAIHESVPGLEEAGFELDMGWQAELQATLRLNKLHTSLEAVRLDVNRVQARACFRP